ncbi:MAG: hypothetical protein QM751_14735 [Paludibacteraceae bacterium]
MKHQHIYDAQGRQLCCTQEKKIYTNAGAGKLTGNHSQSGNKKKHVH